MSVPPCPTIVSTTFTVVCCDCVITVPNTCLDLFICIYVLLPWGGESGTGYIVTPENVSTVP